MITDRLGAGSVLDDSAAAAEDRRLGADYGAQGVGVTGEWLSLRGAVRASLGPVASLAFALLKNALRQQARLKVLSTGRSVPDGPSHPWQSSHLEPISR
jgi:hypothetical protein